MDTHLILVGLVAFLAAFTQSLSGFGLALVAMALLPHMTGLQVATPLVALFAVVIEVVLLVRYRRSLEIRAIWRVVVAALAGIPLGVAWLTSADERLALGMLGVVIAVYALYALSGLRLPRLERPAWGFLAGLLGGMLGGAYNTSGPPVIVYGDCRAWPPDTFKGNLQGYFIVSSLVVLGNHVAFGNLTGPVWRLFWWCLPFIAAGLLAGFALDRRLKPETFRRLVLLLLVVMGARLIL